MHRREFLAAVAAAALLRPARAQETWQSLEKRSGGRLGVGLTGRPGYREGERFPMCSTFKALLAGCILGKGVDLDRTVRYTKADLLDYAPVTKQHTEMNVRDLCEAAVTVSDNTAANLLLPLVGGPAGLTAWLREQGDSVTRLDRTEPTLNECTPGDPRDTTTPAAMAATFKKLALANPLLEEWLVKCQTGDKRIRAGVSKLWRVGDKTGTGDHGTWNDVAILWPPHQDPFVLAVYLTGAKVPGEPILAEAARLL